MISTGQEKPLAFIVGGSGGIGRSISLLLAKSGYDLLIHGGKNAQSLDSTCQSAKALGSVATPLSYEFGNLKQFFQLLPQDFVPHVLVVAFGPIFSGSLAESNLETWLKLVELNLTLPGALISHFGPLMAKRGFGRIVLFGGTNTDQIRGFKEVAAYAAAKTGLGVLAKSAAKEYGSRDVTCNVLCPGYVETEYYDESMLALSRQRMPTNLLQTTESMAKMVISIIESSEIGLNGAILSCAHGL